MSSQELLPPAITERSVARPLISRAVGHYRDAKRATIQVMADIRLLQDGQVHILYGYSNFAHWAEDTFEGLAAGNVRQLARCGAIALKLQEYGYLDLRKPEGVGTSALRELSTVNGRYGVEKMIETFLTARGLVEPDKEVVGTTVLAAMQLLMPPVPDSSENEKPIQESETHEPEDDGHPEKIKELIEHIRDLAYDLPESLKDLQGATRQLSDEMASTSINKDQTWIGDEHE